MYNSNLTLKKKIFGIVFVTVIRTVSRIKKEAEKHVIMKTSCLFTLGFILFWGFSCEKEPAPVNTEPKPIAVTEKSKKVISAGNRFGFEIFQEILNHEDPDKNLMISPLSIEMALSMTYNGAGGDTKQAFEDVLHTDELPAADLNQSMYDLREALTTVDPRVTMEIANSIWYRNTFHVEDAFLNINRKYYDAEVKGLDFSNPASINIINGWVDDKTHHKIPEIIDDIDPMTIMFLINAVYFNGTWKYRFDKENTRPMEFYVTPDKTIQADMMYQKGDFLFTSNELFSAIELPYGRGNFSMIFLLPKTDKSLEDLAENLTPENWQTWTESFTQRNDFEIYVPKFTFDYKKKLNDALQALGLGVAFSGHADFTGINPDEDLYISDVRHKTFIKVDEEGTEAAAVTSVEIRFTSAGPDAAFILDRPFFFVIKEKYTHAILFIGRVSEPKQTS